MGDHSCNIHDPYVLRAILYSEDTESGVRNKQGNEGNN